jgi:hypothetical protein
LLIVTDSDECWAGGRGTELDGGHLDVRAGGESPPACFDCLPRYRRFVRVLAREGDLDAAVVGEDHSGRHRHLTLRTAGQADREMPQRQVQPIDLPLGSIDGFGSLGFDGRRRRSWQPSRWKLSGLSASPTPYGHPYDGRRETSSSYSDRYRPPSTPSKPRTLRRVD